MKDLMKNLTRFNLFCLLLLTWVSQHNGFFGIHLLTLKADTLLGIPTKREKKKIFCEVILIRFDQSTYAKNCNNFDSQLPL